MNEYILAIKQFEMLQKYLTKNLPFCYSSQILPRGNQCVWLDVKSFNYIFNPLLFKNQDTPVKGAYLFSTQ